MNGIKRRIDALEKKQRQKELQKKWREENKEKIKEYAMNRDTKKHRAYESHESYLAARREKYKENPEKIRTERIRSAANLLFRYGLIDEADLKRIKGLCE